MVKKTGFIAGLKNVSIAFLLLTLTYGCTQQKDLFVQPISKEHNKLPLPLNG